MKAHYPALILSGLLALVPGCSSDRIEETEGGVVLSVTDFDGLATRFAVNSSGGIYTIEQLELTNSPKNPSASTSNLMDVEIEAYEVAFRRVDTGSRTPPTLFRTLLGFAPIGGTLQYDNLPLMGLDQLANPPLSDLLFENGAFDQETGAQLITLDLTVRFFGRTVGGDEVASGPVSFTVEFVP